jgi:glutathione-regulated potassium-efflux system ancillary protein KefC
MDAVLGAISFFFGLLAQKFRLPPLVGFLISGFVLQALGKTGGPALFSIANLGVTLMLFGIGVKLRLRTLARPEIWGGTSLHTLAVLLIFTPTLVGSGARLDWNGRRRCSWLSR